MQIHRCQDPTLQIWSGKTWTNHLIQLHYKEIGLGFNLGIPTLVPPSGNALLGQNGNTKDTWRRRSLERLEWSTCCAFCIFETIQFFEWENVLIKIQQIFLHLVYAISMDLKKSAQLQTAKQMPSARCSLEPSIPVAQRWFQ